MRGFLTSLRFRLALVALLVLLPSLGLTLYSYWEERELERLRAQEHALELARLASANVEGLVQGAHQLLAGVAQLPEMRAGDPAECAAILAKLLRGNSLYAGLGVVGTDGTLRCRAVQTAGSVGLNDRTYLRPALEKREFAVGGYRFGPVPGKATLNFGYPLPTDAFGPGAVVFGAFDLAWLNLLAAKAGLPEGSTMTVMHKTGAILARYPEPEKWVGRTLPHAPVIAAALNRWEGTSEVPGLDGVDRLYAFTSLSGAVGLEHFRVSIGIPPSVAFADLNTALEQNLIALALVALLLVGASALAGETLVMRPVGTLLAATRRLSSGDLSARTGPPYHGAELGQLARAFDGMPSRSRLGNSRRHERRRTSAGPRTSSSGGCSSGRRSSRKRTSGWRSSCGSASSARARSRC